VGVVVALADKLETLVGMFGIGNLPTGDRDPFALRRHALGVIRMLVEKRLPLDVNALLASAVPAFGDKISDATPALADFIYDRLRHFLSLAFHDEAAARAMSTGAKSYIANADLQGFETNYVEAVLANRPQYLGDLRQKLLAVAQFSSLPEAPALAAANKRVGNILKKAEGEVSGTVKPELLVEAAEKALYEALQTVAPKANAAFEQGDHTASLQQLAALKAPVDAFFDGVMVNAEDAALKANRLALLQQLHQAMNRVADLSRLA
jgi:glycyl-tRNA synthetase beta chain